ncbi:type II toxin-antitoxin system VapC family toxin [Sorangium cellulosum]|uniref:type II toxin-antitoxin system VapC family toxin n=1 Tax=Sorangium cellulosum TaxID=56 RepID=UPI000CF565A1
MTPRRSSWPRSRRSRDSAGGADRPRHERGPAPGTRKRVRSPARRGVPAPGRPFRPILSIVSIGELLAFAKRRAWGTDRSDRLNQVIKQLVVLDINRAIAEHYAAIHTFLVGSGRTVADNDVWIAATAAATSALLITTDKDFEVLAGTFLQVSVFALHPGKSWTCRTPPPRSSRSSGPTATSCATTASPTATTSSSSRSSCS